MKRSIAKTESNQAGRTRHPPPAAIESSSQSLCQACGLCCNGTLFSYVPLTPGDLTFPMVADRVSTKDGQSVLEQSCVFYRKRLCSIYHNGRPHICAFYRCELLKRYESGAISKTQALEEIHDTIRQVNSVKEQMRAQAGSSAKNLAALFMTWIASQGGCYSARLEDYGSVWTEYQALLLHLKNTFGFGKNAEIPQGASRPPGK